MRKGAKVRVLVRAGLIADDETRFVGACEPGAEGIYLGKHPNKRLPLWHLVKVGELRAPLHESQFEQLK